MKYKIILILLLSAFYSQINYAQNNKYTISGQVKDAKNGEDLISVTVFAPTLGIGTVSNVYGFYSLTLEEGTHELVISFVGFAEQKVTVDLTANKTLKIEMVEDIAVLGEVVVSAEKEKENKNIESTEMSVVEVKIESIRRIPHSFGEVDIIKYIQFLPGVKTVGEGTSGFYIRGGNADQK